MTKQIWKPGTLVYPIPVVMVSCGDYAKGEKNIITVAWTGTINSDPAMVYISVRPERHSYSIIKRTKEFVINLTTKDLTYKTDYCGVKSGKDIDKFKELGLTDKKANKLNCPIIDESPINIECKVKNIIELGSHHMFIGEVVSNMADEKYIDETGRFNFEKSNPICYSHGQYYALGEYLGKFGYSVKKNLNKK